MSLDKRRRLDRRLNHLKTVRTEQEALWRDLADFVRPDRLRLVATTRKGDHPRAKIRDNAGTMALRIMASGMHSGITSPTRPWFRLTTADPELADAPSVKEYLATVESRMRQVFSRSNFYTTVHTLYADMGLFGQGVALLHEDDDRVIHLSQLLHGEFWISTNHLGIVDTLYRRIPMTVEQVMRRWPKTASTSTRNLWERGNKDDWIEIYQAIEPRVERDPNRIDKLNMPFASVYWEAGVADIGTAGILEEGGYRSNPILAPRWDVISTDHYGVGPGADALPDIKSLQLMQLRKLEAIDKMVRPPMKGPTSLRNARQSLLPGSITYVDDPNGQGFTPAMQVQLRIAELAEDQRQHQDKVREAFFADVFLMISQMDGVQPRQNMEIIERKEEKMLMLGPVLERVHGELLQPSIDRTYEIMNERGLLPPPPPELEGQDMEIEFVSILAQAQKAVATGSIERTLSLAGNLAGAFPSILDKVDADEALDRYAELVGAPPSMILADDRVNEIRKEREAKAQQEKQIAQAAELAPAVKSGADAAKVLSETNATGGTAGSLLNRLGLS